MSDSRIDKYNNKYWTNDKCELHRLDGPAVIYPSGSKEWYINGERHREDGPACEYTNGIKHWFYKGKHIECNSQEEFLQIIKFKAFW